jgi:hypothetical protein
MTPFSTSTSPSVANVTLCLHLARRPRLEIDAVSGTARLLEHQGAGQAMIERMHQDVREWRRLEKPHRLRWYRRPFRCFGWRPRSYVQVTRFARRLQRDDF